MWWWGCGVAAGGGVSVGVVGVGVGVGHFYHYLSCRWLLMFPLVRLFIKPLARGSKWSII